MDLSQRVAEILLKTESVKIEPDNPFTWTSGLKSPIYCDNRRLISFPEEREEIVKALLKLVEFFGEIDCFAGTATAGIPWAAFLAQITGKSMVYVRSKPKEHGAGRQVEGVVAQGEKVLVVEDLLSTGGSALTTIKALKEECGANVVGVVAVFSYDFVTMKNAMSEAGVAYKALSDFGALTNYLYEKGVINQEQMDLLLKFSVMPEEWGSRN